MALPKPAKKDSALDKYSGHIEKQLFVGKCSEHHRLFSKANKDFLGKSSGFFAAAWAIKTVVLNKGPEPYWDFLLAPRNVFSHKYYNT